MIVELAVIFLHFSRYMYMIRFQLNRLVVELIMKVSLETMHVLIISPSMLIAYIVH